MALILTGIAAYAAYTAAQQGGDDDSGGTIPNVDESIDLNGKTSVELLPMEVAFEFMAAPISTITFINGNHTEAATYIKKRVADIIYRNPFLGGWLIRQSGEKYAKLVYDPRSDDVCEGIVELLEPAAIDLTYPETPYPEYGVNIGNHGKVPILFKLINRNKEPLFRVALIPDSVEPSDKFALVMSMSHQIGDPTNFYQIYNMLLQNKEITALNPVRKHEFSQASTDIMGRQEVYYVRNALSSPMFDWGGNKDESPIQKMAFYISNDWLQQEMSKAQQQQQQDGTTSTTTTTSISTRAFLAYWFFNITKPTVGFIPYDFRNHLDKCNITNKDAGTYYNAIPYTSPDYATPGLIEQSFLYAKRCGHDADEPTPSLPRFQRNATYAVIPDWTSLSSSLNNVLFGDSITFSNSSFRQLLHMPLYSKEDMVGVPNTLSFCNVFVAGKNEDGTDRLGAIVLAKEAAIKEIAECGIVDQVIWEQE